MLMHHSSHKMILSDIKVKTWILNKEILFGVKGKNISAYSLE